jgi:hypothetical protein
MKKSLIHIKLLTSKGAVAFYLFCGTLLILTGCAPGSSLIREADLKNMEQRLADQERITADIHDLQKDNREILTRIARKSEEFNDRCQPMISFLEKILDNQAASLSLLEEIHEKLTTKHYPRASHAVSSPAAPPPTPDTMESSKIIVGAVEQISLTPPGILFPALMDTGTETSSLDARNISRFERDGERWVRFDVFDPETGEMVTIEQPLQRRTRILQSSSDEYERRLVVELSFSFRDITQIAEFTLADRSHLNYPVLIGRNILKDVMVVDVSRSTTTPSKNKNSSVENEKKE